MGRTTFVFTADQKNGDLFSRGCNGWWSVAGIFLVFKYWRAFPNTIGLQAAPVLGLLNCAT